MATILRRTLGLSLCVLTITTLLEIPAHAQEDYVREVQSMYVAYYGRPGDPGGVAYWAGVLEATGTGKAGIIDTFGDSAEYNDRFGALPDEVLVNNIFQQLFGRDADPEGLAFYVNRLQSGQSSLGTIALNVLDGTRAGTDDNAIVSNKLDLAELFTDGVEDFGASYSEGEIDTAYALIGSVGLTDNSLLQGKGMARSLLQELAGIAIAS